MNLLENGLDQNDPPIFKVTDPSKVWLTSDLHLYHKNIIKYCNRPFLINDDKYESITFPSVRNMNENIISNWNDTISDDDIVLVLGDVAFCRIESFIPIFHKLKGKKILVPGNHDSRHIRRFDGWNDVSLKIHLIFNDRSFLCNHYPLRENETLTKYEGLFHGHSHGNIPHSGISIDVGVDCWNYKPVNILEALTKMEGLR